MPPTRRFQACSGCQRVLVEEAFARDRHRKTGRQDRCRSCVSSYMAEYNARPEQKLRAWQGNLTRYGMTPPEYEAMLEAQGGLCAICEQPETSKRGGVVRRLAVDHCHETGEVRGLLCNNCNRALGMFGDSPATLAGAIAYLEARVPAGAGYV